MTMHLVQQLSTSELERLLEQAVHEGSRRYFADCRSRVASFVHNYFFYPGAVATNRHAMGWDLLRAPLNLFWAPFYLVFMLLAWCCNRVGWVAAARLFRRIPPGLDTQVQRYLVGLTYQELLQRPLHSDDYDALREAIHQVLADSLGISSVEEQENQELATQIDALVEEALNHYAVSRTASADIANSVISMLIGAFAFQKYTPGGIAIGLCCASVLAKWVAIGEFWAGPWLGELYYAVVPVVPSTEITLVSIVATIVLLAVLACFSGLIIDPIQAVFGIHQWRLRRLIDHLEKDFQSRQDSSFRPKEPYLARLLDMLDLARSHFS